MAIPTYVGLITKDFKPVKTLGEPRNASSIFPKRYPKCFVMALIAFAIFVKEASAQFKTSGTIIVVGITNQEIAIAADSLLVDISGKKVGNDCKISTLNPKFLFASSGNVEVVPPGRPDLGWYSSSTAKIALSRALPQSRISPRFAIDVANIWADTTLERIRMIGTSAPDWFYPRLKLADFVWSFFGGLDEAGDISVAVAVIRFKKSGFTKEVYALDRQTDPVFIPLGRRSVFNEFSAGQTERAKAEAKSWELRAKGMTADEQAIQKAIRFVGLTIKYGPSDVGGSISAAVLKRGGTFQWVRKSPYCK